MPLFLFWLKEMCFFIIQICTCIKSVRKILGNQLVFPPSIKVIPFSKYLSFYLGVVLGHANWAHLIVYTGRRVPHGLMILFTIGCDTGARTVIVDDKLNSLLIKYSYSGDCLL